MSKFYIVAVKDADHDNPLVLKSAFTNMEDAKLCAIAKLQKLFPAVPVVDFKGDLWRTFNNKNRLVICKETLAAHYDLYNWQTKCYIKSISIDTIDGKKI